MFPSLTLTFNLVLPFKKKEKEKINGLIITDGSLQASKTRMPLPHKS